MDHKTWLWRKKPSEKAIPASEKGNLSPKPNEEDIQAFQADKGELENEMKILNVKLSSAISDCNAKDELAKQHATMAQEARAGWEKAKAEVVSLKNELDEALQHKLASEERLTHLDAALKECMQQLCFVREEQEKRIHDAVMKASTEHEKSQMILEEKLVETNKRLLKVGVEHANLSKALLAKEKLVEDLNKQRAKMEADFNALMTRLDSTEKDNASLKYEVRVLDKELEIRNEEREFNRRTSEASHKQHLESVKKIAKLESECQRLRLLVRKRLPGPAAMAKMKNEVEMLGRDSVEMRRRKLNPNPNDLIVDSAFDNYPDAANKRIHILTEQLCAVEEENKALKVSLNKKTNELQFSRIMHSRTASKLSEVESRLEESSKGQKNMEPMRNSVVLHEFSQASLSDIGSDDKFSSAESWASALISELEHFRIGKLRESPSCKTFGSTDISLMDDFVEMEKMALVSVDKPSGNYHVSSEEANMNMGPLQAGSIEKSSEATGRELVHLPYTQADFSVSNKEMEFKNTLSRFPGWIQDILKAILEQKCRTKRNTGEILEDIRKALVHIIQPDSCEVVDKRESASHLNTSDPSSFSGYTSWKPSNRSSMMDSPGGVTDFDISLEEKSSQQYHSDLNKSICRIIELIEGISLTSPHYSIPESLSKEKGNFFSYKHSETSSSYMVRILQWKTSELRVVLQQFVHACYDLLREKTDFNKFAQELSAALDWIMNHCFSLQDVSSMRDAIKKHFDWDETRSESEAEVGVVGQFAEAYKLHIAAPYYHNSLYEKKELQPHHKEENRKSRDELINAETANKDLEKQLQLTITNSDSLINLQESEKTAGNLRTELENLSKTKGVPEDQVDKSLLINEDAQLTRTKAEPSEACPKFHSELVSENKNICYEENKDTYLESMAKKEIPNSEFKLEEKQLRTDWEITAASEKLAECQETILNLGKQLKALTTPKEAALLDKVIPKPSDTINSTSPSPTPPETKMINQRSSLLDQMIAEDNSDPKKLDSQMKRSDKNSSNSFIEPMAKTLVSNGHKGNDTAVKSLTLVPSKKQGGSLLRKLLWRKKKGNSKKNPLSFASQQIIT